MKHDKGTTSACAENTHYYAMRRPGARNYLRVRGEYANPSAPQTSRGELPPRARRIHECVRVSIDDEGTTSACAENTDAYRHIKGEDLNYLRVRGEYPK